MKHTVRIFSLFLALCLLLAGCGAQASSAPGGSSVGASSLPALEPADSASAVTDGAGDRPSPGQEYAFAIRDARDPEDNQYYEVVSGDSGAEPFFSVNPNDVSAEDAAASIEMMLQILGVEKDALDAYAFTMSLMNVRAYAIGVFKPADGQADAVQAALEEYVSLQQKAFEQYLEDQYEIAKGALVRTLPGGEIVLVLCEDAADVMASLEKALA